MKDTLNDIGQATPLTHDENPPPVYPPYTPEGLKDWLRVVEDPELHLSLVGLGLIYDCEIEPNDHVRVDMTLTSPGCPAGDQMIEEVRTRLMEHPNVKGASVQIVWEPKWDPRAMAEEDVKEVLGIW